VLERLVGLIRILHLSQISIKFNNDIKKRIRWIDISAIKQLEYYIIIKKELISS
jgi:hypothetical protein